MAAITETDKMNFRTQIVDGKPRIFFDPIDNSSTKPRSKRNSRATSHINRRSEPNAKSNNQKYPTQYDTTKRQTTRNEQPTNTKRVNEDGSGLGVYMTMDEIAELVNAVKENAKSETSNTTDPKAHSPPRQRNETNVVPVVPNLDLALEPPPLPPSQVSPRDEALGKMADKKRQKWMREKAEIERMQLEIEYDQLKHQLSPRQKKNPSPQRSTFQYDFPPPTNKAAATSSSPHKPLSVPKLPQALKQNGHQYDMSTRDNEDVNQDSYKTRLMEKKQQQWKQENSEKTAFWDPFGRPGAGAPKNHDNPPRTTQPPFNGDVPYPPPVLQQQQSEPYDNSSSSILPDDRARVPAAMRTNLAFGNARRQDDVDTVKELERRQWLDDLHKQIEDNKRQKHTQQETERRQDFLRENVQPLVQQAANRHQQPSDGPTGNYRSQNSSGHHTYPDAKPTGTAANHNTGENIFGPTYDSSSRQNTDTKVDLSHLHVGVDRQQPYRPIDARRDEAVNTVDATFRSDHGIQTDLRIPPNRRAAPYAYEESDLPPRVPHHHQHRNADHRNQQGKKTARIRSPDDNQFSRHTAPPTTTNYHSNNTGSTSQMGNQRTQQGPLDAEHRPLWNYNQKKRGDYVPNSKRDPHYEKRQRLRHLEQGNFDRVDDVQKKTCYNRWNSDSEIQSQKKQVQMNRTRSTIPKTTMHGNHKDESIMNLLKGQSKQQQPPQEVYGTRYPPSTYTKTDDEYNSNQPSSLDRYENHVPYTRSDERPDQTQAYSPPTETTSYQQVSQSNTNGNNQPREWENTNRQYSIAQPTQYSVPATKQEHILQQLSNIKENLIRRQRELASPVNAVPV